MNDYRPAVEQTELGLRSRENEEDPGSSQLLLEQPCPIQHSMDFPTRRIHTPINPPHPDDLCWMPAIRSLPDLTSMVLEEFWPFEAGPHTTVQASLALAVRLQLDGKLPTILS